MRRLSPARLGGLGLFLLAVVVLALVASLTAVAKQQSGFVLLPPAAPAGQMTLYGHVKALTRKGGRYVLRFDPAWFTSGPSTLSSGATRCLANGLKLSIFLPSLGQVRPS